MTNNLYYSVVFSLIKKLDKEGVLTKDAILTKIILLLIDEGICTESEVEDLTKKFEDMIQAIENKGMKSEGVVSYSEAFMLALNEYKEFDFRILN